MLSFVVFDPTSGTKGSPSKTLFAGVSVMGKPGIYRSDDAGNSWKPVPKQPTKYRPNHAVLASDGNLFITYGTGTGPEADRQREVLKKLAYGGFRPADDSYLDPIREMVAGEALADARRSGDKAKIAAAQAEFDKVQAAAAQRRAANPDV